MTDEKVTIDVESENNFSKNKKIETVLNQDLYTKMIVQKDDGTKIAEITIEEAIPAEGYQIVLIPKYN
ncbi:hypothetical protein JNUCC83_05475 [Vagococcus sp. JNUCC 83]